MQAYYRLITIDLVHLFDELDCSLLGMYVIVYNNDVYIRQYKHEARQLANYLNQH